MKGWRAVKAKWGRTEVEGFVKTDEDGVLRSHGSLGRWLVDEQDLNLNDVWLAFLSGKITRSEMLRLYLSMSYSVDGLYEVFGQRGKFSLVDAKTGKEI